MQKAAVLHHAKETSSGPKTAQRYLRDLAQLPRRRQAGANAEDEGVVLANGGVVGGEATQLAQVQQLTGFGGYVGAHNVLIRCSSQRAGRDDK